GAVAWKNEPERRVGAHAEATTREQAAHASEREPDRHDEPRHVGRAPIREAILFQQVPGRERGADESTVVREPAGPKLGPPEAIRVNGMTVAKHLAPSEVGCGAFRSRVVDVDERRIGAEVDVVPEVTVGQDVQDARAGASYEQREEAEVDDDVGV